MYSGPALDHSWLRHCPGFNVLRNSVNDSNTAEVGVYKVLRRHPSRTWDPKAAKLFYVAVFEYSSYYIGNCNGTTHRGRMEAAEQALRASAAFAAHGGADHVFATSAWSISGSRELSLSSRMAPLSSALGCGSAGRYKAFPSHGPSSSAVASCTFEIPYQANLASGRFYRSPADPKALPRTNLLHFAGALDVCCTGRSIRCAIAPLYAAAASGAVKDVIVRPIVPTSLAGKPCTTKALKLAALAIKNRTALASRGLGRLLTGGPSASMWKDLSAAAADASRVPAGRRLAYIWRWAVNNSDVDLMAREMTTSIFCLSPAGDNCVSARFFSAVAAGCLPVVICDHLAGAFPSAVKYETFWIKYKQSLWTSDPLSLLSKLRAMSADEIRRRQTAMEYYRSDILYDAPNSQRMGSHVLAAATRCAERRLPKSESCRVSATQRRGNRTKTPVQPVPLAQSPQQQRHEQRHEQRREQRHEQRHEQRLTAVALATNGSGTCECSTRSRSHACGYGKLCELPESSLPVAAHPEANTASVPSDPMADQHMAWRKYEVTDVKQLQNEKKRERRSSASPVSIGHSSSNKKPASR